MKPSVLGAEIRTGDRATVTPASSAAEQRWHLDETVVRIAGERMGTVHLTALTHLAFCLSPTVFAGALPRHILPPGFWSRGFHRASGTIRPSDYSQDTASHFACAYRVTSLGAARGLTGSVH
jgi:hypothetical protein